MSIGIYEIRNTVNGKRYIGSTGDFAKRCNEHRRMLRKGAHHSAPLQRAWNKYGASAFVFRLFQPCPKEQLIFQEQRAIHGFMPEYNICKVAGSPAGVACSSEKKKKLSSIMSGRQRSPEAVANCAAGHVGKSLSLEHCAAISLSLTGRKYGPHSAERSAAQSAGQRGKPHRKNKGIQAAPTVLSLHVQ